MTTLEEKVNSILGDSDFNDLSFEERKRICKYTAETRILTIWQMLNKDREYTTEIWRQKQHKWLKNCVESYQSEYGIRETMNKKDSREKQDEIDNPPVTKLKKCKDCILYYDGWCDRSKYAVGENDFCSNGEKGE